MDALRKQKIPTTGPPMPLNIPMEVNQLVGLGVAMAQDTILLLEAGTLPQDASANAAQRRMQMRQNLTRVRNLALPINGEITRKFD